jgi:arabinogalactan oligomer/maltooligosaccharide transport system substrate-binding protein
VISPAFAAVFAAALVAANGAAGPERPELVLWHAYRAREAEALEQVIADINKTETRFSVRVLAVPYDAYLDKITAAIPRGRGPDIFVAAHDTIGDWAEAKLLLPVDDLLDPATVQALMPGLVDPVVYRGTAWGLPLAFKSLALLRNTALEKNAPGTLAELEQAALRHSGEGKYGLVYENGLLYFHAPLLFGFGGRIFAEDGSPALGAPESVAALRYAMRLQRELKVVPQETSGATVTSSWW